MTHSTNNHIELEDGETTVVVNQKEYDTTVIRVENGKGERVHSLEVEDWKGEAELVVID